MASNHDAFSKRLNDLIMTSGLSHKSIEEKTGIAAGNISHYRTGKIKPSFDALVSLADLFDVTLDYLMRGTNQTCADSSADSDALYLREWQSLFLSIPQEARPYVLLYVDHYLREADTIRSAASSKKQSHLSASEEHTAGSDPGSNIA